MFTYADFYNYMIIMPGYDHNGWKACKGLQGYKLYHVSHIVNLQHMIMIDFRVAQIVYFSLNNLQGLEEKLILKEITIFKLWKCK